MSTIMPVELQRVIGDGESRVGGDALGHGAKRRGARRAPPPSAAAARQSKRARRFEFRGHVGEPKLQRLKLVEANGRKPCAPA